LSRSLTPDSGLILGSLRRRAITFLGIGVALSVVFGLLSPIAASAQPETPKPESPAASASASPEPQIARTREEWRKALSRLPRPKAGCYTSTFPRVEWKPVACGTPPPYPMPPALGHHGAFVVGNGTDYAAHPTSATISAVESSFPSVSAGITESGPIGNTVRRSLMRTRCKSTPINLRARHASLARMRIARVGSSSYMKTTMSVIGYLFSTG
jgi:hypothetical protein